MAEEKVLEVAPDFELEALDGKKVRLSDLRGKWIVLYFYPKDDTPGCTKEACDFRDSMDKVVSLGATVLGVSRDNTKSHQRFASKYSLNFTLLSDPDGEVHRAYGAFGLKKMYGKEKEGTIRSTFIIDPSGHIRKAWRNVKVEGHVAEVLEALKTLMTA